MKQLAFKHGSSSNIFIDQHYGPDTTWRRNQALACRKELKAAGSIVSGYVQYPANLMVKYSVQDQKYVLNKDFSKLEVPLRD